MVCPNCGANLPENAQFCANCGKAIAPTAPTANTPKLKKKQYLASAASPKAASLSKIVWIVCAVCVLVLALSANAVTSTAFHKIPLVSMVVGDDADEFEDIMDEGEKIIEDAQDALDEIEDDLTSDEIKLVEKSLDKLEKFVKTPSLGNMKSIFKYFATLEEEIDNEELRRELDLEYFTEDAEEMTSIISVISTVATVCAIVLILITLLATWFKKTGVAILALILSLPFCIFLAGAVYTVLTVAAFVALAVILSMINKEYKAYLKA